MPAPSVASLSWKFYFVCLCCKVGSGRGEEGWCNDLNIACTWHEVLQTIPVLPAGQAGVGDGLISGK